MIDELLAGASTEEEIAGPGGLLAELTKRLVERAMEVELARLHLLERIAHTQPRRGCSSWRRSAGIVRCAADLSSRPAGSSASSHASTSDTSMASGYPRCRSSS